MNPELIETFLILAKTQSITKTANILFMSQSTISYRLKTLEKELDVVLFERDKGYKNITLTKHGTQMMNLAKEYKRISEDIHNFSTSTIFKSLIIGAVDSVHNFILKDLYKQLLNSREEDWRVTVRTQHTKEIYENVSFRSLDIGFALSYYNYPNTEAVKIFEDPLYIVSKHNPIFASQKIILANSDLGNQLYINWGEDYIKWHNSHFSFECFPKFKLDSAQLAFELLEVGYWFFAPASVCYNMKNLYEFKLYELSIDPPVRNVYMISNIMNIATSNADLAEFTKKLNDYIDMLRVQNESLKILL
ncbi:LysR family transcriptional regulator [Alkalibaculum sp. M08DMB]|uniref:LysR family transcriptional regulator n=1 Tax=Alkalibaculum sporogenes TaxID=2655001 RepID=A0A6A7K9Y5_9FIRM|nr:LysR family transcriptional regulator [Alkalibaculum sporogenes]MPW26121.1 LysR family transcriptional regulator [Alkalibaculum sporogenes]